MTTWDVLISTIPHRHTLLCRLLAEFDRQAQPGFGVRVLRDNLDRPLWAASGKWADLTASSMADYICICDDDDWIAPDYVAKIMAALRKNPDYVGFRVEFTYDGALQLPVEHSLRHSGWTDDDDMYRRDISHLNPVRRELSEDFYGRNDWEWAAAVRASGMVRTEEFIDEVMYFYRRSDGDRYDTPRAPLPGPLPELPSYPWLTIL